MNASWGYLIGAAVTGLSLLFNQWRSDRREQARIAHERAQVAAQWQKSREEERERWAREDARRWVLERRQASVELLGRLEPWVQNLRRWANPYPLDSKEQIAEERRALRAFDWQEASTGVHSAWAILEIVGSDELRQSYQSLVAQMFATQAFVVGTFEQEQADRMVAVVNERYGNLLDAIRHDLGVIGGREMAKAGDGEAWTIEGPAASRSQLPSGD
ncbi:hypothetical protein GCM10009665_64060 [Kitasatospora nipponensis]|uniref:Uncharacterized protein n=1 Tax=Kitasatospora nipponensis TaxID=258049 RepID=A0ABN1WWK6_9ACTN